jgi:hypothetical protein
MSISADTTRNLCWFSRVTKYGKASRRDRILRDINFDLKSYSSISQPYVSLLIYIMRAFLV